MCGKGGCGKSTVATLLAREYQKEGKNVLVIDSDESNYGLHRQLGFDLPEDFTHYFGGKKGDYDVIKIEEEGGNHIEASEGTLDAWNEMIEAVRVVGKQSAASAAALSRIIKPATTRDWPGFTPCPSVQESCRR